MSRKLPEELAPVLARTGRQWPQADEDGLRRAGALWREFGVEAERLGKRGGDSVRRITGENSGRAVEAFGEYWRAFSGSGRGHLDDAHSAAGLVAGAFDKAAGAVESCKADIVAALTELAADLKQAEEMAAKAKAAAAAVADAAGRGESGGILGGLRKQVGSAAAGVQHAAGEKVAEVMAAVAVEAARLKIGGLLDELGRAMKDGLGTALKEPAVVTLLRLAPAAGPGGAAGGVHNASFQRGPGGAFDPVAAGLPAALAEPGVLSADGTGLAVVVGQDGKPVVGVPGLAVKLDEQGQPVLGEDGRPVIVRADGTPVEDAEGLLVVAGPDGAPVVGVADLAVKVDRDGEVVLGKDGLPVLTDKDGKEVSGLPLGEPGRPGGRDGLPGGPHTGADLNGDGKPDGGKDGLPVGPDGKPVTAPDAAAGTGPAAPGATGPAGAGPEPADLQLKTGPVTVAADLDGGRGGDQGGRGDHDGRGDQGGAPEAPARQDGPARPQAAEQRGGGHGGGPSGAAAGWAPAPAEAASTPAPAPVHSGGSGGGHVSVRTDSVLAPPAPETVTGPVHQTGGGHQNSPNHGPSAPAPTGPVPTGPVPTGPVHAGPVGGGGTPQAGPAPYAGGPTGSGPVAAPGAAAGSALPGQAVGAQPGQQPGQAGQAGQPGAAHGGPRAVAGPGQSGPALPHPVTLPGPSPTPPPPAAAPVFAPAPARPDHGATDGRGRRLDGGESTAAWGVAPVATAHALALQLALRSLRRGAEPEQEPVRLRTIADSRPYGLPGGLGPVDPEHQAEVERRVPRDADGLPLRHPDPAAGGWAEALNAGGCREPGRANNSLEIALSAVDTYTGRPTCAAPRIPTEGDPGERGGRDRAERELGAPFRDLGDGGDAYGRLSGELRRAGHGAQAVLLTLDGFGRPHAWNAVNHKDTVTYLDHQTGRRGDAPLHPAESGLWAIALAPDGRPLDLAR
ncbi:toxin glutamine deamidase domain-containing protein [Kitasatospora sp. NPDC054939]